ncbi:MAG: serine hydrolase domain-containing protein [Promethearchaeota archaeon]
MKRVHLAIVTFLLLSFTSLFSFAGNPVISAQVTEPDYWPTEDWQIATPESQGLNPGYLTQMEQYLDSQLWSFTLRSILIIRHGYLVYENYMGTPERIDQPSNIYSCTKSVSSALIGIAIDQGYLDLDDRLVDIFSHLTIQNLDSRKEAITVEHLLTMTSGLPWDEWTYPYGNPNNDWDRMTTSPNWVEFVINRPMDSSPGSRWVYNTGGSHLLSAIVHETTNMSTLEFAETNLFTPLGITDYYWSDDPQGNVNGGSALQLRPRDMAKFGFLYLHNGTWDGTELLPASWIAASSSSHATVDSYTEYGYQWWIHPHINAFAAHGYLNQHIFVIPNQDMVVVATARSSEFDPLHLLEDYIIPAASAPLNPVPLAIGFTVVILTLIVAGVSVLRIRRKYN